MSEHRIVGQINRRKGYLYFVDGQGFVKEAEMSKGRKKKKPKETIPEIQPAEQLTEEIIS